MFCSFNCPQNVGCDCALCIHCERLIFFECWRQNLIEKKKKKSGITLQNHISLFSYYKYIPKYK